MAAKTKPLFGLSNWQKVLNLLKLVTMSDSKCYIEVM